MGVYLDSLGIDLALDFNCSSLSQPELIRRGDSVFVNCSLTGVECPQALTFVLRSFSISVKRKTKVWATKGNGPDDIESDSAILLDHSTAD